MGASNFYYRNASKIYTVLMNMEVPVLDDEGNETDETETQYADEWELQDTIDGIVDRMKENSSYGFNHLKGWDNSAPRSYPVRLIGSWSIEKYYAGVSIEVIITATMNSGYHEGACLDWTIQTYVSGYERDEVEQNDLTYYGNVNEGLSKIIAPKANKWLDTMKEKMSNDLEKVFSETCGIELKAVGTFSNGETVYSKAN